MAHWGWYWKIKLKHKPKKLCSHLDTIDSFEMFRNKEGVAACMNKVALRIPSFKLKAFLYDDHYFVTYLPSAGMRGCYKITIEKQSCNYGGFRYFFHCPRCDKRMRILYLHEGKFFCRRCLNLGYFSQRLRSSDRILRKFYKIKDYLEVMSGSLDKKPPRMWQKTFKKLKLQHFDLREIEYAEARHKEFLNDYPNKLSESDLDDHDFHIEMKRYERKKYLK